MLLLTILLTACGGDDDEAEPTTAPVDPVSTTAVTKVSDVATPDDDLATPAESGTPDMIVAPSLDATPTDDGTPPATANPAVEASPDAAIAAPPAVADDSSEELATTQTLNGAVSLPGILNERFVIGDDGCVGLGDYAGLQAGQQVIVRDEAGRIIGVTQLEATESAVVCGWTFEVDVPVSVFYEVSIPMVSESVFHGDAVADANGQIELLLP